MIARAREPSFAELFTPKLVTVLREGYGLARPQGRHRRGAHRRDRRACRSRWRSPSPPASRPIAASTPRSSAASSSRLWAAAASRSAVRPAPSSCWSRRPSHSTALDGLVLATLLSGLILLAIGFLRLGTFIKYIPYPVTVGFTAGIAVIIFSGEISELLGLDARGQGAGTVRAEARRLWPTALPTVNIRRRSASPRSRSRSSSRCDAGARTGRPI